MKKLLKYFAPTLLFLFFAGTALAVTTVPWQRNSGSSVSPLYSTDKVGINTTTPGQTLTVDGTSLITDNAIFLGNLAIGTDRPTARLTVDGDMSFISANGAPRTIQVDAPTAVDTPGGGMTYRAASGFGDGQGGPFNLVAGDYGNVFLFGGYGAQVFIAGGTAVAGGSLQQIAGADSNGATGATVTQYGANGDDGGDIILGPGVQASPAGQNGHVRIASVIGGGDVVFNTDLLTSVSQTVAFPNKSGTFALTSDISPSFFSSSTNAIYNNFGYKVGVNSSSPIANLVVQGSSTAPTLPLFVVASSSGASFLTVLANGNVGVNTTTPQAKLEVDETVNGNPVQILRNTGNGTYTTLQFRNGYPDIANTNKTVGNLNFGPDAVSGGRFVLEVSDTSGNIFEGLRLDSSGNLSLDGNGEGNGVIIMPNNMPSAIGIKDPTSGQFSPWLAYSNAGSQWFSTSAAGDNAYRNLGGRLLFGNGITEPGMMLSGDRLGIHVSGVTNPTALLQIQATNGTTTLFTISSTSGASILNVTSSGNVGINTSTPGQTFVVTGSTTITSLVAGFVCSTATGQLFNGCTNISLGKVTTYNGLATQGQGLSPIVMENDIRATTTAATLVSYTPTATSTLEIGGYINITAVVTDVLNYRLTWTDENGTSQTTNFVPMGLTSASLSSTGYSPLTSATIRSAPGSPVTLQVVFTTGIGSVTYDIGGWIKVIQ